MEREKRLREEKDARRERSGRERRRENMAKPRRKVSLVQTLGATLLGSQRSLIQQGCATNPNAKCDESDVSPDVKEHSVVGPTT